MTRFAGHSDITNFLQRNQFADKVGAAGMNAYADQAIGGFLQDAHVTTGGMKADQLAEIGKIRRRAGATMTSQDSSSMLTNSLISGVGSLVGGGIRGGHFGGGGGAVIPDSGFGSFRTDIGFDLGIKPNFRFAGDLFSGI
jgi:hypothetical protein